MSEVQWYYKNGDEWIKLTRVGNETIEKEYNEHLNDTYTGSVAYHCFGDGITTCIDFEDMVTFCGSTKCHFSHQKRGLDDNHNKFELRREI
jgi:hypothetical protein